MAGTQGFEPRYADPESAVLPLDDVPIGRFNYKWRSAPLASFPLPRAPVTGSYPVYCFSLPDLPINGVNPDANFVASGGQPLYNESELSSREREK